MIVDGSWSSMSWFAHVTVGISQHSLGLTALLDVWQTCRTGQGYPPTNQPQSTLITVSALITHRKSGLL